MSGAARMPGRAAFQISNKPRSTLPDGTGHYQRKKGKIMNRLNVLTMMAIGVMGLCASTPDRSHSTLARSCF
jgi:hypothetical protein